MMKTVKCQVMREEVWYPECEVPAHLEGDELIEYIRALLRCSMRCATRVRWTLTLIFKSWRKCTFGARAI